jgi:hypothetical protein
MGHQPSVRIVGYCMEVTMETFEWLTLVGGVMIGMGVLLFCFAAAVAFFIGAADDN